jgi:glycosyltransferase involved in cell wall biosynthesis
MKNYTISVIIPMYNSELTIERCISSVFAQDYKSLLEIIIVDDGSSDNSVFIVENIIKNNTTNINIFLIKQSNAGVSSARNAALKTASNDLIAFLDSDDAWFVNKLSTQIHFLNEYNIDFIGSILSNKPWNWYLLRRVNIIFRISLVDLMFKFCFQPSTVLFRKEIIQKVGLFNEEFKYAEEGEFFMRILHAGFKCYMINQKLTIFGYNNKHGFGDGGLSGNLKEMNKGEIRNHKYAFNNFNINIFTYYFARIFSYIKYIRRVIIIKIKK